MTHPYISSAYAQAFGAGYDPVYLPVSGIHVLKRLIPGTSSKDAMGPYPLCPLPPEGVGAEDIAFLKAQGVVSLVLVTDPFFQPDETILRRDFDHVQPYKQHFIHDFEQPSQYSKHHRYEVRRALKMCDVRVVALSEHMDAWYALYSTLIEKRNITGIQAFPRAYFEGVCVLNPVMVGAFVEDTLVSAHLWFAYEGRVYSHLAASSEEGYRLRAAYAVYDFSLRHFAGQGTTRLDLGGGAGVSEASKGLSFLKEGFSNATLGCYLCGKIVDADAYVALSAGKAGFFPAYRG